MYRRNSVPNSDAEVNGGADGQRSQRWCQRDAEANGEPGDAEASGDPEINGFLPVDLRYQVGVGNHSSPSSPLRAPDPMGIPMNVRMNAGEGSSLIEMRLTKVPLHSLPSTDGDLRVFDVTISWSLLRMCGS